MDQAGVLRRMARGGPLTTVGSYGGKGLRGIAFASGKGGVGKTNTVANIAYQLNSMGYRSLVFDADMGLGNIHILLGLAPRYNLDHVLRGERSMSEIILKGPGGIEVLPASSGNRMYSELTGEEKLTFTTELEALESEYDIILFDIGAGISSNVMYFCSAASEIAIVTTEESTSFADAYALMKILHTDYDRNSFKLIVNNAHSQWEAKMVRDRLEKVADRFGLNIRIDYLGHVMEDSCVPKSVKKQRLFSQLYPGASSTKCVNKLARALMESAGSSEIRWGQMFA